MTNAGGPPTRNNGEKRLAKLSSASKMAAMVTVCGRVRTPASVPTGGGGAHPPNGHFALFTQRHRRGVLGSSPRAAVSLRHRPVLVWRPEVGELGEEVVVWPHLVLRHPPVRQDGD